MFFNNGSLIHQLEKLKESQLKIFEAPELEDHSESFVCASSSGETRHSARTFSALQYMSVAFIVQRKNLYSSPRHWKTMP